MQGKGGQEKTLCTARCRGRGVYECSCTVFTGRSRVADRSGRQDGGQQRKGGAHG